jgi:D-inositol-3-phosphate glycosyltransferase
MTRTRRPARRVAMVSEHASPLAVLGGVDAGGQNVHVAALATHLARRGAEVVVHTRRDDPTLPEFVRLAPGVLVHHVDAGPPEVLPKDELFAFMDRFAAALHQQWRASTPDVVHTHFWMSGYAGLAAARPLGIPVVHTFHALGVVKQRHQGDRDTSPPERQRVERDILSGADHVIATCTDEVFELLQLGGEPRRMSVVPCGVDLRSFAAPGPTALATGESAAGALVPARRQPHRLLCVGRLVERKGIGEVVASLAQVPHAELLVAGGPERDGLVDDVEVRRLMGLAEVSGVVDRVRFLGRVGRADLPALIRSADVVVCVPWYEPFGIVPLEAMACGVPVVASAVGGLIDTVVDGVTGVHVPPRDPTAVAAAVQSLLADPDRRRAFGAAGVERVRTRYSWARVAAATADVYAAVQHEGSGAEVPADDAPTVPVAATGTDHPPSLGTSPRRAGAGPVVVRHP